MQVWWESDVLMFNLITYNSSHQLTWMICFPVHFRWCTVEVYNYGGESYVYRCSTEGVEQFTNVSVNRHWLSAQFSMLLWNSRELIFLECQVVCWKLKEVSLQPLRPSSTTRPCEENESAYFSRRQSGRRTWWGDSLDRRNPEIARESDIWIAGTREATREVTALSLRLTERGLRGEWLTVSSIRSIAAIDRVFFTRPLPRSLSACMNVLPECHALLLTVC